VNSRIARQLNVNREIGFTYERDLEVEKNELIVDFSNCGVSAEAQNVNSIAKGIEYIYRLPQEERDKLGKNGKKYVLEHFTYEKLAKQYAKSLEEL